MFGSIISNEQILKGTIVQMGTLTGTIISEEVLKGVISKPTADEFEGPYQITPETVSQSLNTMCKTMTNNLEIRAIPFYEVSNQQGGFTVTIGGGNL